MKAARVFLRNGETALVLGRVEIGAFMLVGRRSAGPLELWLQDGRWSEDGAEHPLDIVSVVTGAGALVALNGGLPT